MPGSDGGQMPMVAVKAVNANDANAWSDGEQMPMMPMASGEGGPMPMLRW